MSRAQILLEIVFLLQGTPVADFARANLTGDGERVEIRCAKRTALGTPDGDLCKRSIATALLRYGYRLDTRQLAVLADLYVEALDRLEPGAQPRVRAAMCARVIGDGGKSDSVADAICGRLSRDY